ncbi:MAG: pyridoxamine 5'-phosphate oxidase family protein [Parabacteroides sp.]|nr:pyridoxamine 5'-phosphate oxidase family protein [Parabacteroides sp.]
MEKVFDFFNSHNNVVLGTVEENKPKLRVLQLMKQEGTTFYFATSKEKAVYKQLQQNPYVEFISMDGSISVKVVGKAFLDIPDDMAREIYNSNLVLSRFHDSYRSVVYFGLSAEKIDFYDLSTTPVTFRSILLA